MKLYQYNEEIDKYKEYGSTSEDFSKLNAKITTLNNELLKYKNLPKIEKKMLDFIEKQGLNIIIPKNFNNLQIINAILAHIEDMQVISSKKQYIVVGMNKKGFICKGNNFVIENVGLPHDLYKGYYKIIENKVVLDEKQKQKYLRTLGGA